MQLVIAAQQAATRSALRILLREEADLQVIDEATDSEALVAHVETFRPDVVVLDWRLPGQPLAQLIAALHNHNKRPGVIVLSGRPEIEQDVRAAGADAFFHMGDPPWRLVALLRTFGPGVDERR
ncbi:MAG: response regulator [Anaerolineae bacterium]|jgi:DNA-binding NarL/FixJ family response regulator